MSVLVKMVVGKDLRVWRMVWNVCGWEDAEKRRVWSVVADVIARSVPAVRSIDHEYAYSGCSSGAAVVFVFVFDDDDEDDDVYCGEMVGFNVSSCSCCSFSKLTNCVFLLLRCCSLLSS